MKELLEQALELPLLERLALLEALRASIYNPVSEQQQVDLDKRLENPSSSRPWREIKNDLAIDSR